MTLKMGNCNRKKTFIAVVSKIHCLHLQCHIFKWKNLNLGKLHLGKSHRANIFISRCLEMTTSSKLFLDKKNAFHDT